MADAKIPKGYRVPDSAEAAAIRDGILQLADEQLGRISDKRIGERMVARLKALREGRVLLPEIPVKKRMRRG